MRSALVVAVLLSAGPDERTPDALARAHEVMLGNARPPWVLHATGSIAGYDKGDVERFVLEWEPRRRRDVRGYRSSVADAMLDVAEAMVRRTAAEVRVQRNGAHIRYLWERSTVMDGASFAIDVDPATGLMSRARSDTWLMVPGRPGGKRAKAVTAEFSDFKPVGGLRLPHRIRLQARDRTEHWTIDRIEIVPLP